MTKWEPLDIVILIATLGIIVIPICSLIAILMLYGVI